MKEFIHIIRQIFLSTRVIENRAKYITLCLGCSFIHAVFVVLMQLGHIGFLCIFNVAATIFYLALSFIITKKEIYKALFISAFIEVEVNASVTSIMLGPGYDFMIYTLSLIPGAFYLAHTWSSQTKSKRGFSLIPIVFSIIVGVVYVLVDVLYKVFPPTYNGDEILAFKPIFHYFNILIAVILILAFSILFALEVRYMLKLLNDENTRLDEIASRDPLTKALNRRSLYNIINSEIENANDVKFGLIILDIDDFKKVNDTYGHVIGDQVLIRAAHVMKNNLREKDYFCRWGGEEFLIMIHGEEEDYAVVAERIRSDIEKLEFTDDDKKFSVTATMGIAQYQQGIQIRTLVDMADQKMYFGKQHGKNQVVK